MFDRQAKTIKLQGKTEPVIEFTVWFMTPFGLIDDFEDARRRVAADDMDLQACIKPVAVARSETLYEVIGG